MKISGIAAVVTGGASGMGAATARHLASLGAKVALLDINAANCEAVAKDIGGAAFTCDITDAASSEKALSDAKARHGAARLVVNCAGIAPGARIVGRNGPHDLALFRKVIERGVIVNTASIAGFEGQIGQAAYAASKGGIIGLTLPAARELAGSGIRVVTIAPGLIETPLFAGLAPATVEALTSSTLFPKRLGKAEEFARLVQTIAENLMLNGSTIRLDGAVHLGVK
jgi:NAD(P)-dependent dehydrogenase (short-subunit alcohol dehydrogenase family)